MRACACVRVSYATAASGGGVLAALAKLEAATTTANLTLALQQFDAAYDANPGACTVTWQQLVKVVTDKRQSAGLGDQWTADVARRYGALLRKLRGL